MIEHIRCKSCDSPNCKGCNMLTLERMLNSGKFDCLMNENRSIDRNAEVEPVKHGRWVIITDEFDCEMMECSCCGAEFYDGDNDTVDCLHNYCPNCGAKMCGGADHEN